MVEARTDTPAMLEALQAIAAFYGHEQGGNTAEARKNLRQVGWLVAGWVGRGLVADSCIVESNRIASPG